MYDDEQLTAPVSSTPTTPVNPADCAIRDTSTCVPYADAGAHVGKNTCVCCVVERTFYASGSNGQPTFLDCHDPYQGWFYSLIWIEDRSAFTKHFGQAPELAFKNHKACFWGLIETYKGNPEIILRDPLDACISKGLANGS
jgi:hypothetical protein